MSDIECQRCGETRAGLEASPIPGVLGERVLAHICRSCYEAWQQESASIIQDKGWSLKQQEDRAELLSRFNSFMGFDADGEVGDQEPDVVETPVDEPLQRICLPTDGPRPYWPF